MSQTTMVGLLPGQDAVDPRKAAERWVRDQVPGRKTLGSTRLGIRGTAGGPVFEVQYEEAS